METIKNNVLIRSSFPENTKHKKGVRGKTWLGVERKVVKIRQNLVALFMSPVSPVFYTVVT